MFHRTLARLLIKLTYGDTLWREMGEDLADWNIELNDLLGQGLLRVWLWSSFTSVSVRFSVQLSFWYVGMHE
jgi:hypothetical protein